MDCLNTTKESSIYWNKEAVTPPNQSEYRYNGIMNYLEGLEKLLRSSTNMLYDSNRSYWNQIESKISDSNRSYWNQIESKISDSNRSYWNQIQSMISDSNRSQLNKIQSILSESNLSQMNGIQGITTLVSEFHKILDAELVDHNRLFQKLEDLNESIRGQFGNQEEEFLLPLLKNVDILKKRVKSLKNHVKSTREEIEDIAEVQDELMLLLEMLNSSIVQLLSKLPVGSNVSSITIRGNEISLDAFINYDAENNTATFRQIDGSLVVVDSKEIVAITFPSAF